MFRWFCFHTGSQCSSVITNFLLNVILFGATWGWINYFWVNYPFECPQASWGLHAFHIKNSNNKKLNFVPFLSLIFCYKYSCFVYKNVYTVMSICNVYLIFFSPIAQLRPLWLVTRHCMAQPTGTLHYTPWQRFVLQVLYLAFPPFKPFQNLPFLSYHNCSEYASFTAQAINLNALYSNALKH